MSHLSLFLLKAPAIEENGHPISLKTRKGLALLAYLTVTAEAHTRETLAALFWPEASQKQSLHSLRNTLFTLKKQLGSACFTLSQQTIALNPKANMWLDVAEFRQRLHVATSANHPTESNAALIQAVDLYQTDFMVGFTLRDCPAFDEWQFFERESLRQALAKTLETLIAAYNVQGDFEAAIPYAQRWLALDPLHEAAHYQLMQLYAHSGQRTAALRQYDECQRILAEELGGQPTSETTALYQSIRVQPLKPPSTPPQPQLKPDPPPDNAPLLNVPNPVRPFIGREEELTDIRTYLTDPACRLLTLVGLGGIGKTRLAIQAARHNASLFQDGVCYIDLTPLRAGQFSSNTLAGALALPNHPNPQQQVINYLRPKTMLLLFDNFEDFLSEASLITDLLTQAPQIKIIITSRQTLDLAEEWSYFLFGLPVPHKARSAKLSTYSSVRLFVQRARQASNQFSLTAEAPAVAHICRLVEGMPLGLELAAVWTKVLPCADIAQEITHNLDFLSTTHRNVPDRHRSLRAVFESSWQRLTLLEQQTLAQLATFRGGFSRQAFVEITKASLFALYSLINKSLVQRADDQRYTLHELLRQFATEKLAQNPALQQINQYRHATYYATLLQQTETLWHGEHVAQALTTIQTDLQNIQTGWHWAVTHRQLDLLNPYIENLHTFYETKVWYQEGYDTLALALNHLTDNAQLTTTSGQAATLILVRLLTRQAQFCQELGDPDQAIHFVQSSLNILAHHHHPAELCLAYKVLGGIYYFQGNYTAAQRILQQSLNAAPATYPLSRLANIHLFAGAVAFAQGNYPMAQICQQNSLKLYKRAKNKLGIGHATRWLGRTAQALKYDDRAEKFYQRGLALFQELGNLNGCALCCRNLGVLAQTRQDYTQAKIWFSQSYQLGQGHDGQFGQIRLLNDLGDVSCSLSEYDEASAYLQNALKLSILVKSAPLTLQTLSNTAHLILKMDHLPFLQQWESTGNKLATDDLSTIVSLFNLVIEHPATPQDVRRETQSRLQTLQAQLPSPVFNQLTALPNRAHLQEAITDMITTGQQNVPLLKQIGLYTIDD